MKRKNVIKRKTAGTAARKKAPKGKSVRAKQPGKIVRGKAGRKPRSRAAPVKAGDAVDTLVAASAQALKLPLDPAWHGGVKFNLHLILRFAALIDEFPLPDDAEPAPVFHA
jgi:hypothetical protein